MSFTRRHVKALGREVFRLGLALNYGIEAAGVEEGLARGIDTLLWTNFRTGKARDAVRAALARDRARMSILAGPTLGYFGANLRRGTEKLLRELNTDYLDVLMLFWLGKTSALTSSTIETLAKLREEGKIRAVGTSIHDRVRAGQLVADSPIDLFMIRYNAAHPGAERDVFPHLHHRKPAIVAYTATSWRKLLTVPRGWEGPTMTAGDCYRFCLSSPHVDLTLCGPANRAQLREALDAVEKGPLTPGEESWMRRYGVLVHGGREAAAANAST
jgi:aryl-alcohol dehydrogenase-like predicted oxidoreductase